MEQDIRKRVEKLHSKIDKLRKQKKKLSEQNKELLDKVYQLETEQLYSSGVANNNKDAAWMSNMRNLVDISRGHSSHGTRLGFDGDVEQSEAVQKLMKGYVQAMQKLEVKFMELENTTTDEDTSDGLKQKYKSFKKWLNNKLPFGEDIQWALLNYGIGISAFFSFYRFVVLNSLIMFISYLYFLAKQVWNYDNSKVELFDYNMPKIMMFSQFTDTGDANVYATAVIMMMVLMTYSSFNKWISENKQLITQQLLSKQADTNKFAALSFNIWDFSQYTKQATHKQKYSIAEEYRLLLQDEEIENVKQGRTDKERYILYARRALGIFINIIVVVGSWVGIYFVIVTQDDVLTKLPTWGEYIHPTGAITMIGIALPTFTFMITEFEQWETKIQTMKNQIWRLYAGRIANLIVAGLPAYLVYYDQDGVIPLPSSWTGLLDAAINGIIGKQDDETEKRYSIFQDGYLCFEDVAAFYMFKLVVAEFVVGKTIKIAIYLAQRAAKQPHAPYNVAESIIEILYFQGLLWFSIPLFPFLAIFAPLMMYCNFKFEKYVISRLRSKTDASWKAEETGSYFIVFYNLTLLVGLVANYYFMRTQWPCYKADDSNTFTDGEDIYYPLTTTTQGPFSTTNSELTSSQPWDAAESWMRQKNLGTVLDIFSNALLFMGITIIVTLRWALTDNVADARNELLDLKDREIDELYKKLWSQKRRLELEREQNLKALK